MKVGKTLSIAIISALMAACSSSGGSKEGSPPSLGQLPGQYRDIVSKEKTIDLEYDDGNGFTARTTLAGKTGGEYNLSDLPNGTSRLPFSETYGDAQGTTTYSGTMLVYQQPYSVVIGSTYTQGSGAEFRPEDLNGFWGGEARGFSTPAAARQTLTNQNAIFWYKGVAFDGKEEATLNYTMLFGQRTGHGSITGFARTGHIDLNPATLENDGSIRGKARIEKAPGGQDIRYELSFFGPNAEEIAGDVYDMFSDGFLGDNDIIFAGEGKPLINP